MTTTNQKVNLDNCTHEQIFKAISKIQAKAAPTFIKDERRIGHHMKHITLCSQFQRQLQYDHTRSPEV